MTLPLLTSLASLLFVAFMLTFVMWQIPNRWSKWRIKDTKSLISLACILISFLITIAMLTSWGTI